MELLSYFDGKLAKTVYECVKSETFEFTRKRFKKLNFLGNEKSIISKYFDSFFAYRRFFLDTQHLKTCGTTNQRSFN